MKSKIIIRQTEDWASLDTYTYLRNYRKKFDHMIEWSEYRDRYHRFVENVILWNHDYPMDYMRYRGAIHDIAKKTWEATGSEIVQDVKIDPDPNLILIPTDDDDWFNPDLVGRLYEVFEDDSVNIVVWCCYHLLPNGYIYLDAMNDRVSSNGYAIRANVATNRLIHHHASVNEVNFTRIDDLGLSVWLRHSACWTKASREGFEFEPMAMPDLNHIEWAKPHIEELLCLNMPNDTEESNPHLML